MNGASTPSLFGRQRGTFAFLATVLLLVVVAVAIRLVLGSSQSTTYATGTAGQSVQAYLLGASAQERAVAMLKSAIPNSNGFLNPGDCTSINSVGTGSYGLGSPSVGSVQFTALTPTPTPVGCSTDCTGCNVQVTGTVGSASRVLNVSVLFGSSSGVTGFGTNITDRLRATSSPSVAVFNLAYRRQMSNTGGPQATVQSTCSVCLEQWNIESSSGSPSVGGEGVYASLNNPGTYTITQTLNLPRNFVEVGLLFSGGPNVGVVGSFSSTSGGQGKMTIGTGNTATGQSTDGAVLDTDWCRGGDPNNPNISPRATGTAPFADTLVFGFSGRSTTTNDTLTSVTFNCEDPTQPNGSSKCVNRVPLTRQQRFESCPTGNPCTGDMYSEIWVAQNPDLTASPTAPVGTSTLTFQVSNTNGLVKVNGVTLPTLVTVKSGSGLFQPGTLIVDFDSTNNKITLNQAPKKALSTADVICAGTCAYFDHTTNGNTSFNIVKSAGTTQWAAGFMCLKGSPSVIPIFEGKAVPVAWYEPF